MPPSVWKPLENGFWELSTPQGNPPVQIDIVPGSKDRLISQNSAVQVLKHLGYAIDPEAIAAGPLWKNGCLDCVSVMPPTPHNRVNPRIYIKSFMRATGPRVDLAIIQGNYTGGDKKTLTVENLRRYLGNWVYNRRGTLWHILKRSTEI